MNTTDKVFSGSIPELYDTYLVPLIFEGYAIDMAERVVQHAPKDILETAAGSGVVTRALAPLLSAETSYTATDLNQAMIDRARELQSSEHRIEWQQADALNLPFDDNTFDVVLCQFGVMFFPDRVAGYREAHRVLRPGGLFVCNVWDDIQENVFAEEVTKAAGDFFPDDPPRFLARTPHGHHDLGTVRTELRDAGFNQSSSETIALQSTASSPSHPAIAYCQGTPLRNEIEQRDPEALSAVTEAATKALASRFGNGPISGKIQAHVVTSVKD